MALIDIDDKVIDGDLVFTESQIHRAYNLLKYKFQSIQAIGLDIEKMIFDGLSINQVEQILLEYFTDFDVKYKSVRTEKNERIGKISIDFAFKEALHIEL